MESRMLRKNALRWISFCLYHGSSGVCLLCLVPGYCTTMEPGEPVRSNMDEHTRSNTRRLSSILKAPRTPLKVLAVENEDFQEEQTQKIEKKRKYRRVSFATTNDIMYISSPGRNEDPDITGTNCQKERNCATENVSQQIIGMETLLKAPLHVSQQNKENVFHTDVQHHDSDKTVLFSGEDSAYMDMTHCHTIVIDANADEINSASKCGIANFVFELGMVKSTNSENSLQSDSVFYRSPTASKNQIQESEMGDFVVNSSKKSDGTFTGGKKPTNIFQCSEESVNKTDAHSFFSKLAAQSGIIDKENQYPVTRKLECAEKSVRSFPSKKNALDFDHSVVFSGSDNMDMTESHTVFIDGREILLKNPRRNMEVAHTQTIAADVSQLTAAEKLSKFDQDDMEMTGSQTVVIDAHVTHGMFNPTFHSQKSLLTSREMVPFSENDAGVEMKRGNMTSARETKNCPTENRANVKLFNSVNPVSQWANCSTGQYDDSSPSSKLDARLLFSKLAQKSVTGKENETPVSMGKLQYSTNNQAVLSDPDDMEITRSQTVVIGMANPSLVTAMKNGKKSFSYMPKDKTVIFSEEDYGMDMTTALTLPIEENSHIPTTGDKTMERMTPIMKAISEADVLDGTKLTANRLVTARSSISANLSSDSQDMEMTKRQNAVDSKKHSADITNPLFRSRTKTHSYRSANKTNVLSDQDCGVDRTTRVAVPVNKNEQLLSAKDCKETAETLQCAIMAGVEAPVDDINAVISLTSNPKKASGPVLTTDSPNHKRDSLRNETRSRLDTTQISPSCKTFIFSEDDYNIEMTRAGTVRTESHCNAEVATTKYSSANSIVSCLDQLHTGLASSAIYQGGSSKIWTMDQDPKTATSDFSLNVAHSTVPVTDKQAVDIIERSSVPVVLCNDANNVFAVDCAEATSKADCSVKKEDSLSIDPLVSSQKQKKIVKAVSKNPRRVSLADVKSQLENIRGMINEPEDIVNRCLTAPLPQLGSDFEGRETIFESTKCSPNKENFNTQNTLKEHETNLWEDSAVNKQNTNMTAPVNIWERKTPVTRMAFGGFLPKLPQKAKVGDQNNSGGLLKKSVACDTSHQSSSNAVENIEDEILPEISSEEDFTETLESQVPTCTTVEENPSSGSSNLTPLDEPGFVESVQNVIQSLKRSLPVDGHEETVSGERKMRKSPDPNYAGSSIIDIAEENLPSLMTKSLDTINISNSTTFMRADGTFENSAQRCSQYDMDFEAAEYEYDLQKKLEDGSITVREFLKIFAIDFVIHRPRQSVLPDNFALAQKVEDLFVEKYINRPKQRVYEDETRELSKMVEKLKSRMWEQDKPLKTINHSFWESVKSFSEEQFKALGSKLKERKAYFRKKSKAFSHEMKKDLYVNLVQTTQLAEQNLQEKIASVDDLLKNLDECLQDLQSELDLLDSECVNGVNINVNSALLCTLKAKEQELESLNTTVAEKERIIGELKLEKNSTHDKINSMMEETKELEKYKAVMDRLNEWKLCEKTADRAHFNFLYGSVQLEVLFESHANGTEQTVKVVNKVGDIRFHLQLDERNSQDYACLVHKLIAQFIHTKCNWVKEYPTESDIPLASTLLHDVGLVVSRCRALGEEIHRLKKWGSIKLDILDIACRDTQIKVVFSSLKVSAKFEVTLVVTPAYPVCSLQVLHFQNYIGNIRMYQIEDIVTSIAPSKNYLTRIVKKIHEALLK
ncbi:protein CASC5 [Arapaima gigas]